jgi:DNA-binding response OmpR family regulator
MAEHEQNRDDAAAAPGTLPPADVLLKRIVVVDGPRSADLVSGLTASGMQARVVSAESLQSLIAGLVVVEEASDYPSVRATLQILRRRRAPVAALALVDLDRCGIAFLGDLADAVLPANASVEMIALQLRALARLIATDPPAGEPETITVRNLSIDLVQRVVRAGNQVVDLTPTEFQLLAHLARRRGVVSHTELVGELHSGILNEREAKNMLKVHIWRLRAKLAEALPDTTMIVTVRGFGYLLERRSGNLPQPPRTAG